MPTVAVIVGLLLFWRFACDETRTIPKIIRNKPRLRMKAVKDIAVLI